MTEKRTVVKPTYYANWSDVWAFPLAYKLLPLVLRFPFITPNVITIFAFILYIIGSLLLFIQVPNHLLWAGILLPTAFVLDDIDGQLARARKMHSEMGNYLDKVLDFLKIYILTISLSYAVYQSTGQVWYIFAGFTACFFFTYRYYIKLETVMNEAGLDTEYLNKSSAKMKELEVKRFAEETELSKTWSGKLKVFWMRNRTIFFVDEAEFAVFTGIFAIFNKLEWAIVLLAASQVLIAIWRFFERMYQVVTRSEKLYYFMRK